MNNRMKILFLDVDGVLNTSINMNIQRKMGNPTSSYHIKLPGDKIYRLKRIIMNTGAQIVLSSSWRIGFNIGTLEHAPSVINLENQLSKYGMNIYDITPLHKYRNRGIEIQWWLNKFNNQYGYIPNYVIIDNDIDDIVPIHKGHIVKTNMLLGLQDEHVNIAVNILNQ